MTKVVSAHAKIGAPAIALIVGTASLVINGAIPTTEYLAEQFGAATTPQLVSAAFAAGYGVGHLLIGVLAPYFSPRVLLGTGLAAFIIVSLVSTQVQSAEVFLLMRFAQGVFVSPCPIVGRSLAWRQGHVDASAKTLSAASGIFTWFPVFAPIIAVAIIADFGWQGVFVVFALYGACVLALVGWSNDPRLATFAFCPESKRSFYYRVIGLLEKKTFIVGVSVTALLFSSFLFFLSVSGLIVGAENTTSLEPHFATVIVASAFAVGGLVSRTLLKYWESVKVCRRAVMTALFAVVAYILAYSLMPANVIFVIVVAFFAMTVGVVVPNATILALQDSGEEEILALAILGGVKMIFSAGIVFLFSRNDANVVVQSAVIALAVTVVSVLLMRFSDARPKRFT